MTMQELSEIIVIAESLQAERRKADELMHLLGYFGDIIPSEVRRNIRRILNDNDDRLCERLTDAYNKYGIEK